MFEDRKRSRRGGFSLMELLIVIAIILVLLTVALPRLTSAVRQARETAAMKAVSTIHTAQVQYYSSYGKYAEGLLQLGPPANGAPGPNAAELIDRDLASGQKGGYKFTIQPNAGGYAVNAVPETFGNSGSKTFYSDQSMGIHWHASAEPAGPNDPLWGETMTTAPAGGATPPADAPKQ